MVDTPAELFAWCCAGGFVVGLMLDLAASVIALPFEVFRRKG